MKQTPHLIPALAAVFLLGIAAIAFDFYALTLEAKYVNSLAALDISPVVNGSALQRAALQKSDLLPVYGSSEITMLNTPYEANQFFKNYPTGFMVFDIANTGASSLSIAQSLAAMGPDLRGKKVVISFTPATVTMGPQGGVNSKNYDPNFSRLHANELAFSPYLSMETKHTAALRMLDFPETLTDDPLLSFVLTNLAGDSLLNGILYDLSWPLGRIQIAVIRMQDHVSTINFIKHHSTAELKVTRQANQINWRGLIASAKVEQMQNSDNNPYGVDNSRWWQMKDMLSNPIPTGTKDPEFTDRVSAAQEWQDLEIVLRVLKELGAQPLIMSRPMNISLWEAVGVSEQAQNIYYQKLHSIADPFQVPVIDFQQFGTDKYFSIDIASHTSREGWIYVDQTLDAFYHGLIH